MLSLRLSMALHSDLAMLVVTFAVPYESRTFRQTTAARNVRIVHTGIGEKAAESALRDAIVEERPRAVISCGFAGALDGSLQVGDLVTDPGVSEGRLLETLPASVRRGPILTVTSPVESSIAKLALHRSTGALAVDMETRAIASVCVDRQVPLIVLRVVSDAVRDPVPIPFPIAWSMRHQRPRPIALCGWLLTHPAKIGGFMRFLRHTAFAARSLSTALEKVLPEVAAVVKDESAMEPGSS